MPDVAKVVDFGLVKEIEGTPGDPGLTRVDAIAGTPLYISPEAITAPETVDGRSDLYALGAVGYFLLTGQTVFSGRTVVEIASHHLHTAPVPPSERLGSPVPPKLEAAILACLAKDQEQRPRTRASFCACSSGAKTRAAGARTRGASGGRRGAGPFAPSATPRRRGQARRARCLRCRSSSTKAGTSPGSASASLTRGGPSGASASRAGSRPGSG